MAHRFFEEFANASSHLPVRPARRGAGGEHGQAQQPSAAPVPPSPAQPADPYAGVGIGDRISGPKFMGRSTVWGANGAAATAHPAATLIGIDTLRRGGSAIDAAIAINAALGFMEPTANGIGGDAYCLMWDPKQRKSWA